MAHNNKNSSGVQKINTYKYGFWTTSTIFIFSYVYCTFSTQKQEATCQESKIYHIKQKKTEDINITVIYFMQIFHLWLHFMIFFTLTVGMNSLHFYVFFFMLHLLFTFFSLFHYFYSYILYKLWSQNLTNSRQE